MSRHHFPTPIAVLLIPALLLLDQAARGDSILWYNGNFDGNTALTNQVSNPGDSTQVTAKVYDDFVVPIGQTWALSSVFSNDQITNGAASVTSASVEIRTGVSAGNGGVLIASLTGTATETPTGANLGFQGNYATEETIAVSGLHTVLGPGTYYLNVSPIGSGFFSQVSTTGGAGAIGTPAGDDGDSYLTSAFFGDDFAPVASDSVEGAGTWDFSMGVIGTSAPLAVVPGPAGLILMSLGGLSAWAWSRLRGTA